MWWADGSGAGCFSEQYAGARLLVSAKHQSECVALQGIRKATVCTPWITPRAACAWTWSTSGGARNRPRLFCLLSIRCVTTRCSPPTGNPLIYAIHNERVPCMITLWFIKGSSHGEKQ